MYRRYFREVANWALWGMSLLSSPHVHSQTAKLAPSLFQGRQRSMWLRIGSCQCESENRPNWKDYKSWRKSLQGSWGDKVTQRIYKVYHFLIISLTAIQSSVSAVKTAWLGLPILFFAFHKKMECSTSSVFSPHYIWCLQEGMSMSTLLRNVVGRKQSEI